MVLFNAAIKELTAKIVYYGPSLGGKTTNLKFIHSILSDAGCGKMLSIATQTDRTIFFDFLPIDFGTVRGMKTRIQLYTVPGQVFYDATRKLVLRGTDAVVFVADSQAHALDANRESFQNLIDNLAEQGVDLSKMPHVIQWNKRDMPNILPVDVLNREINRFSAPTFETCATQGLGVQETFQSISNLVRRHLSDKYGNSPFNNIVISSPKFQETTLKVEAASTGELLEEIEHVTRDLQQSDSDLHVKQSGNGNVIEVPIVLERNLFSGAEPVEIKLKLYLK